MAETLRRDSAMITAGVITPAEPPWPRVTPDDRAADHLRRVLDGLDALEMSGLLQGERCR